MLSVKQEDISTIFLVLAQTHTHTHTHTYIYICNFPFLWSYVLSEAFLLVSLSQGQIDSEIALDSTSKHFRLYQLFVFRSIIFSRPDWFFIILLVIYILLEGFIIGM